MLQGAKKSLYYKCLQAAGYGPGWPYLHLPFLPALNVASLLVHCAAIACRSLPLLLCSVTGTHHCPPFHQPQPKAMLPGASAAYSPETCIILVPQKRDK